MNRIKYKMGNSSLLIIDLMSNFYNKYKRLFTEKEEKEQLSLRNNRSQFINLYNDLNTPKLAINHNLSNTYEDRNNKKMQKLGRSPALD